MTTVDVAHPPIFDATSSRSLRHARHERAEPDHLTGRFTRPG